MAPSTQYEIGMYERVLAVGSTPFERVSIMYNGAIRLCRQGLSSAQSGDADNAKAKAERLCAVVRRLDVCLDFTIAPELCRNLSRLYGHIQEQLSRPTIGEEPMVFEETLQLLQTLWDGFKTANSRDSG